MPQKWSLKVPESQAHSRCLSNLTSNVSLTLAACYYCLKSRAKLQEHLTDVKLETFSISKRDFVS